MMSIHEVLGDLAYLATDNRDKGDKFERLIKSYLQTDPLYQAQFSDVWLWSEWPDRPGPDTGIDLVARKRDGDGYTAIQCKFYEPAHTLQKGDIDSFFTASGKLPFKNRIIVSTTDKWSTHAEDALNNQLLPVIRIRAQDLDQSVIDWSEFSLDRPEDLVLKPKKKLRPHQQLALDMVAAGFTTSDRGQLIMACGTGKTFTSLKIAEQLVPQHGTVLFLVPSISLLSQTLREWTAESSIPLHSFAVCSDVSVGRNRKKENEDARPHDLAFPATTKADALHHAVMNARTEDGLTVIFSTYQSIDVVAKAQQLGLPEFDLIVCDEAHRTTGVKAADAEESQFVRVHDNTAIKAAKRLYMTATPRLYAEGSKVQAKEKDATLWSMDNPEVFGPEFHRLGFGEAVNAGLLTDYKVMVLAVDEKAVNRRFQSQLADSNNELTLDDAVKIIGCWNGLAKRTSTDVSYDVGQVDQAPMRRAVAFARSINDSKKISGMFGDLVDEYRTTTPEDNLLRCEARHVDGTFNVLSRNDRLDWLKEDTTSQGNVCRILSNARCLSEGVDVPALDAVMFLNSRDSIVDVVQSVGRVMRKSEGKDYGYIILPIGVPADVTPEVALSDNKKYQVVWQVLQALRAHDDRFDALVNKIELNRSKNDALQIIGVGGGPGDGEGESGIAETRVLQKPLSFPND